MFTQILLSIFFFFLIIYFLDFYSKRLKLIDFNNERKLHKGQISLVGGLSIYLTICINLLLFEHNDYLNLIFQAGLLIIIIGLIDDIRDIGIVSRLFFQLLASFFIIYNGLYIYDLGSYYGISNLTFSFLSIPFTIFCVLILTNAINFVDGIDGLSSGLVIVGLITLSLYIKIFNHEYEHFFLIILSIIIFSFFIVNIKLTFLNKIFLGDSGSTFLGFMFSWLLIYYTLPAGRLIHPVLVIWCITIPIFDFLRIIIFRMIAKSNPSKPDRNHLHHLLLKRFNNDTIVLFMILSLASFYSFFGVLTFIFFDSTINLFLYILMFFLYYYFVNRFIKT